MIIFLLKYYFSVKDKINGKSFEIDLDKNNKSN
jgi:hypothetical protein